MTYQLQHEFDRAFATPEALAEAYVQALSPPAPAKLDNHSYAVATLGAWPELLGVEPAPGVDADLAPIQPVPERMMGDYLDLLG